MASRKPDASRVAQPSMDSVGLCISLFGPFAVWLGVRELPPAVFPHRKALQLLKLIALEPDHSMHRDQVLELLWPHLKPRSALAQLYKAIHYLRQALASANPPCPPDTLLELRKGIVRLRAPAGVHSDVAAFRRLAQEAMRTGDPALLQQAVNCYKGDLLPADRYETWAETHRHSLEEQLVALLVQLGTYWQEQGSLAEAADAYRQVLALDATREIAHRGLMAVYALQGSRTRALRQYQQCATLLVQEVGVEPSQETSALYEQILNGEVQPLRASYAMPTVELPLPSPLVGRNAEQQVVSKLLERLHKGRGGVLALEGQAGAGKTRFAQEICRMGARRWQVLWGSAHEQEGQIPYMPMIEALRQAIRIEPTDAHLLPAELVVAIPELPATASTVATADRIAAQSALFAGVLRFLQERAKRVPVILVLDDLHAADPGTWKLFHYLARHCAAMPLLLITIWRSDPVDSTTSLERTISSLERQGLLQRLTLSPLDPEEHQLLLAQFLKGGRIDPVLADAIYRLSAGNPLFAKEISRQVMFEQKITLVMNVWRFASDVETTHLEALAGEAARAAPALPVPPSLQELVKRRLASLAPAALRLLQFAAVVGQDIPVPLLEVWSGLDEQHRLDLAFLDVLDSAVGAGLLQERGLSYRFAHPLFRQVIYQQMSPMRRRALHGQVAVGLENSFETDSAALPVEAIAFHYWQAGNVERAVHYLMRTGDRAESVFDHESALLRYEEALSMLVNRRDTGGGQLRAEIYERIGDVQRAIGNVARSLDAYREALDLLAARPPAERHLAENETAPSQEYQRSLHRKITHAAILTPEMPTATQHLQQAWALLPADNSLARARMLITQALYDWHANQLEAALEHAAQALKIAEQEHASVEISQACEMLAMANLPLGRWEEAFQYELRRQTNDWSPEIVVAVDAHLCLYQFRLQGVEPYRQVKQFIEGMSQKATTVGNLRCLAVCHFVLGSLALLQGEPKMAASHLGEALKLHQQVGSPAAAAYTQARLVDLHTAMGNPEAAWAHIRMGLEMADQAALRDHCTMMVHTAGIWNRLAVSDLAGAAELVELANRHEAAAAPCAVCSVDRHAAVAAYFVATAALDTAARHAESALQLAQAAQNRLGEARALHVRGQIHGAQGEIDAAKMDLTQAIEIFEALDNRYELAQTLLAWGELPTEDDVARREQQAKRRAAQELLTLFHVEDAT